VSKFRSPFPAVALLVLVSLFAGPRVAFSQQPKSLQAEELDFHKARTLIEKQKRGESLTAEESAYLDRARAARREAAGRTGRSGSGTREAKSSTGFIPLPDMSSNDDYKGQKGGLYGDGKNTPPESHLKAALEQARQIRPLDASGHPTDDGKIVLLSVGMSNTTQEFSTFVRAVIADRHVSKAVKVVDGAQGGMDAADWANAPKQSRGTRTSPWETLAQRLEEADVTPQQVQVVWIKQARKNPASIGEFPKHTDFLKRELLEILRKLKNEFPNLRIAYLSNRTYAGYANGPLNPEPYAYESAFAVRSLIEDQIAGKPDLIFDPNKGRASVPVLLWGPYLWADGEKGRKTDDLKYVREDFGPDGTHPSDSGRRKVAGQLMTFFKNDPTTKTWFVAK
jgi:hypothetical protein